MFHGDLTFGGIFLIGLVGMGISGFMLKRRLIQAGCINLRALKVCLSEYEACVQVRDA